jgi:hypothetical protein
MEQIVEPKRINVVCLRGTQPDGKCPACVRREHQWHMAEYLTKSGKVRKCSCGCDRHKERSA